MPFQLASLNHSPYSSFQPPKFYPNFSLDIRQKSLGQPLSKLFTNRDPQRLPMARRLVVVVAGPACLQEVLQASHLTSAAAMLAIAPFELISVA